MSGFKPSDLFILPADERRVLTWLMRRGEGSLGELMQHFGLPAASVSALLETLMRRNLVVDSDEGANKRYRARLGSTQT